MKSIWRSLAVVLALGLFLSSASIAEADPAKETPSCRGDESPVDCYNRLRRLLEQAPEDQKKMEEEGKTDETEAMSVARQVREDSEAKLVMVESMAKESAKKRVTTSSTQGTGQSVVDLLPSFFGAIGVSGLSETDESFVFDKTWELGTNLRLAVGATVFRDPDVFKALREALPEGRREQLVSGLQDEIGDFDKTDFRLAATWEDESGFQRFGRDPKDYEDLTQFLLQTAHEERVATLKTPLATWIESDEVDQAEVRWGWDGEKEAVGTRFRDIRKEFPELAEHLEAGAIRAATGMDKTVTTLEASMEELSQQIAELITNQPQIVLEGTYNLREDFTGPEGWSGRLRYEMGLSGNFNDFMGWARKHPALCSGAGPAYSYSCYQEYRKTDSAMSLKEKNAVDRGHRLAIEVQYSETDPLRFDDPDDSAGAALFDLDRTEVWTASLTYGFYFSKLQLPNLLGVAKGQANIVPADTARFDLEVKYDDATGDPMRQDRLVATATVSQKMSDKSVFSISLVWADESEYLGEVDEELSANAGIRWSWDKPAS